jgi:hypothetical protein
VDETQVGMGVVDTAWGVKPRAAAERKGAFGTFLVKIGKGASKGGNCFPSVYFPTVYIPMHDSYTIPSLTSNRSNEARFRYKTPVQSQHPSRQDSKMNGSLKPLLSDTILDLEGNPEFERPDLTSRAEWDESSKPAIVVTRSSSTYRTTDFQNFDSAAEGPPQCETVETVEISPQAVQEVSSLFA